MNENQQGICRAGLIVLVAISLVLCSLSGGISQGTAAPVLSTPFQTLPPINATLATPIGQVTPGPTPIPTIGPGQYFEDDDDLPGVIRADLLDHIFGYSEIIGNPGLFLIWSTDDQGNRHYFVLDRSNEYFEQIKEMTDDYWEYKLEFESTAPWLRYFGNAILSGFTGAVGTACFVVGVVGAFSGIGLPAVGILGSCGVAMYKISFDSGAAGRDASNDISLFISKTEEIRRNYEGIFIQIPYSFLP